MHYTNRLCCVLLLALLGGWDPVLCQQRISQAKCQEYREWMSTNRIGCATKSLILVPTTVPGEHPHHALIGVNESYGNNPMFVASATLISDRYVLTAAHVTYPKNPAVVRLGALNLRDEEEHHVDYEIAEVIRHPQFKARSAYHDIALIRLKEPVRFSKYIRPACLWDSMEMNFTSLVATGFGLLDHEDDSHSLHKFNLDILNKSSCEPVYSGSRSFQDGIMDHQLCLKIPDRKWSQQGESGSPAQITLNPNECVVHAVGILTFGPRYGADKPDIFIRVASFVDWIEGIVWA